MQILKAGIHLMDDSPFINDTRENIEGILKACVQAKVQGIICFGMGMTLREGSREYFYAQLDRHWAFAVLPLFVLS